MITGKKNPIHQQFEFSGFSGTSWAALKSGICRTEKDYLLGKANQKPG